MSTQVERAQDRWNSRILGVERGNTRKPLGAADLAHIEASVVVRKTQHSWFHVEPKGVTVRWRALWLPSRWLEGPHSHLVVVPIIVYNVLC